MVLLLREAYGAAWGLVYVNGRRVYVNGALPGGRDGDERSRNVIDWGGLANLSRGPGWQACLPRQRSLGPELVSGRRRPNEAGILLITTHLRVYVGNSAGSPAWHGGLRPAKEQHIHIGGSYHDELFQSKFDDPSRLSEN